MIYISIQIKHRHNVTWDIITGASQVGRGKGGDMSPPSFWQGGTDPVTFEIKQILYRILLFLVKIE